MTDNGWNVKVRGLNEFKAVCDWDVLAQPEIDDALETIGKRIVDRPGKGLGAQMNNLTAEMRPLGMTVESSLFNVRTKGTSWGRKNYGIVRAMMPRVMGKAVDRMLARWGASTS